MRLQISVQRTRDDLEYWGYSRYKGGTFFLVAVRRAEENCKFEELFVYMCMCM